MKWIHVWLWGVLNATIIYVVTVFLGAEPHEPLFWLWALNLVIFVFSLLFLFKGPVVHTPVMGHMVLNSWVYMLAEAYWINEWSQWSWIVHLGLVIGFGALASAGAQIKQERLRRPPLSVRWSHASGLCGGVLPVWFLVYGNLGLGWVIVASLVLAIVAGLLGHQRWDKAVTGYAQIR